MVWEWGLTILGEFVHKFRIEDLTVLEFEYWVLSIRPEQVTLGALIFSLRRQCSNFADLTEAEAEEMGYGLKKIDRLVQAIFQADKINYLSLMMVDTQVHFHILPRYADQKVFEGQPYIDTSWPFPPDLSSPIREIGTEIRVRDYYLENLRQLTLE